MMLNKNLSNILQGASLRGHISRAKSDGHVSTAEANSLISRARAGGVQPSELAALRQLASESRNSNRFDAGAKAALNNFLGNSADRSYASGRLPPEASLPQRLNVCGSALGQHLDRTRLNALDKHFKKDDGRIGKGEMHTILRNIFRDGNVSPTERKFLQQKLCDPAVSAEAKKEIRFVLSLLPDSRITSDGIHARCPKFPRPELQLPQLPGFPGLPQLPQFPLPQLPIPQMPLPFPLPGIGSGGIGEGIGGGLGGIGDAIGGSLGGSGSSAVTSPSTTSSTSTGQGIPSGGFPKYPTPPTDPKDLGAQNKFQEDMFAFQQASQNMNMFWNMMTTLSKGMKDTADGIIRNFK